MFRLTEQVTSRSAKGRLGHGETWSHGQKSMPSMPINWAFLRMVNGVAGGKALSQMFDQFCTWVAYWKRHDMSVTASRCFREGFFIPETFGWPVLLKDHTNPGSSKPSHSPTFFRVQFTGAV